MTPEQQASAEAHITRLGRKHHVTVRRVSCWEKAGAFELTRIVYVPRVVAQIDYFVALHEFGHVLDRRARLLASRDDTASELVMEAAAWAWALTHADRAIIGEMHDPLRSEIGLAWASFLCLKNFRPNTVKV